MRVSKPEQALLLDADAPWTPRERALRAVLEGACKDLEAGYWRTRTFIDENVPGWVHGDDGPSHPLIRHLAQYRAALADPPPPDPRDEALRLAEDELLRLWKLVPAGCAGVGGVRTIKLEDNEVARLRQIVDAIRAAKEASNVA